MDTFDKMVEFQRELLQSQLKVVYRYQQQSPDLKKKVKRTSKLDIVEDILMSSKQPLHISKIIVHPQNSNVLWVAAQGSQWARGGQRGL